MQPSQPLIDFRNTNTVWASILVETLWRSGLRRAILCPGSRSTPLTIAFTRHRAIESIPVLDERSAAFFALGLAKQSAIATALVCTSGTAGANFYPAAIEARESRVPLLVLTADRPPELRDCHAGQAIDQVKFYGDYPNWYAELATPSLDRSLLQYLRETAIRAWRHTLFPVPGPVHLNLPFRDPLAPLPQPEAAALAPDFDAEGFFASIRPPQRPQWELSDVAIASVLSQWQPCDRGVIVAGVAQPPDPQGYCEAIAILSQTLGWPVLAEALSPLRNFARLNPYLISTYDPILRHPTHADRLKPEMVVQIGPLPTSKVLRSWLASAQAQHWIVDPGDRNLNPLHDRAVHLPTAIEALAARRSPASTPPLPSAYLKTWLDLEREGRSRLDETIAALDGAIEPKAAWLLSQVLPPATPLFIANSMPVRDLEWFWSPGNRHVRPFVNRGANGIDGTLSTALGICHGDRPGVLLTGDLAFLHDTNGLLMSRQFVGHLTVILINNNGGGIFEMLPIAQFDPPFETFFATPQAVDFGPLCTAYGIEYQAIATWTQLEALLHSLPDRGIRLLEVRTDRRHDTLWRRDCLCKLFF
ncbi:2-succinyl-5-enolpyruvyl-6-hydroxy-3-cyclohexene-1-carboxylic-acid synthase [Oxynema aestuarii]|uniref:2-succinyl-5-enolpyruvyl-6-hydroxy-3-cyclohexene-1-carboxylate synthase n=1 Tax=Oxynema aestuarii AP17 TaxID=2064643 RepID=A0A6H1TZM2_9CYAN|nr:2-succinyl-5-enolpyruvyl-6-hydroxy-3-cyclohexene-1-carboxylic-acid synthase [Oxynema aestuarii]QIZ72031.1 2-succinyl-5-enolpyruvyl-6-hydroxy-3-cyclohexene-1-carboxylic-acid synthase [Oxynema aestuarii AP17]